MTEVNSVNPNQTKNYRPSNLELKKALEQEKSRQSIFNSWVLNPLGGLCNFSKGVDNYSGGNLSKAGKALDRAGEFAIFRGKQLVEYAKKSIVDNVVIKPLDAAIELGKASKKAGLKAQLTYEKAKQAVVDNVVIKPLDAAISLGEETRGVVRELAKDPNAPKPEAKPEVKAETPKTEAKPEVKPETKPEAPKAEAKPEVKPEAHQEESTLSKIGKYTRKVPDTIATIPSAITGKIKDITKIETDSKATNNLANGIVSDGVVKIADGAANLAEGTVNIVSSAITFNGDGISKAGNKLLDSGKEIYEGTKNATLTVIGKGWLW